MSPSRHTRGRVFGAPITLALGVTAVMTVLATTAHGQQPTASPTSPDRAAPLAVPMPPPVTLNPSPIELAAGQRFRTGSHLFTAGRIISFVGGGAAFAGLLAEITDAPTAVVDGLVYGGAGANALGFFLSAGGLGMQHNALDALGTDPGRAMFASGTTLGVLGLLGVGAGYFIAASSYVPSANRDTAAVASSLGGSLLLLIADVLYFVDEHRLRQAYVQSRPIGRLITY